MILTVHAGTVPWIALALAGTFSVYGLIRKVVRLASVEGLFVETLLMLTPALVWMFSQLVLPLREQRSLRIVADYAEETATEYRRHVYEFRDIDVIALEGIYLLSPPLLASHLL